MMEKRERIKKFGEVFTSDWVVKDMANMLPPEAFDPRSLKMTDEERLLLRNLYKTFLLYGIDEEYIEELMKAVMHEYMEHFKMIVLQDAAGLKSEYQIDQCERGWALKDVLKKAYEDWEAENDRGTV